MLYRMRGVVSEAMVMCASSPEKVEILDPPDTCVPGDRVTIEGYTGVEDYFGCPLGEKYLTLTP